MTTLLGAGGCALMMLVVGVAIAVYGRVVPKTPQDVAGLRAELDELRGARIDQERDRS